MLKLRHRRVQLGLSPESIRLAWLDEAKCLDADVDFFSDDREVIQKAKQVCAGCPARSACLEFARETNPEFGVWAGQTARELRGLPEKPSWKERKENIRRFLVCRQCGDSFVAHDKVFYCTPDCRAQARSRRKEQRQAS